MCRSWLAIVPVMVSQSFGQAFIHVRASGSPTNRVDVACEEARAYKGHPFESTEVPGGVPGH